jgi:hypothetical protein
MDIHHSWIFFFFFNFEKKIGEKTCFFTVKCVFGIKISPQFCEINIISIKKNWVTLNPKPLLLLILLVQGASH